LISEYVDALTFQELKRTKDLKAIHHASHSVGATLAAISGFKFEKPGRIGALRRYERSLRFVVGGNSTDTKQEPTSQLQRCR
jgi:hypothetical protein